MIHTKNRHINDNFSFSLYDSLEKEKNICIEESSILGIPIEWDSAFGHSVYDSFGNKWIDLTSGIFVSNVGHSNPRIKKAIKKQVDKNLLFNFLYSSKIRTDFAEKLLEISPKYFDRVILSNSGSEAVDNAYSLIKKYGKKNNRNSIVTFNGSYHGRCLSSKIICKSKSYGSEYVNDNVIFLDFPYEENMVFDSNKLNPNDISAFVLETFQGWGAWFYPQKYIQDLYSFCRKNNILVCFDEVQGGFFRTGKLFNYMNYGENIEPDIVCLGKGISSSLPMSAVLTRNDIVSIDKTIDLSGTHSGNPICCAASLENLKILTEEKFQKKLKSNCLYFEKEINRLKQFSVVKKVNVKGMIAGIIFETKELADVVVKHCVFNGVLPVHTNKNSIKIGPPLNISKQTLKEAFFVLEEGIKKFDK